MSKNTHELQGDGMHDRTIEKPVMDSFMDVVRSMIRARDGKESQVDQVVEVAQRVRLG